MFYVNKRDPEDVVDLIHSEAGFCIVIDQQDSLASGKSVGRIIRKGKKQFKKDYKKASPKFIKIEVHEYEKEQIIEEILVDKYGIMNHTEEYIERKQLAERNEYFENMSEEEYRESLKDLADPVVSKKPINRKDLLKAKEALQNAAAE